MPVNQSHDHGKIRSADLARFMPEVAEILLGKRNQKLSSATEWRYGSHGSLSIKLEAGTFYDHENGAGGGVLDLICREEHCDRAQAMHWIEDRWGEQPIPNGHAKDGSLGRIVATYDYHDQHGQLVFQVVRYEPKTFRQRRPDPATPDAWIWKMAGVEFVPYRLPQLLAATTVYVAEGEKDCDNLAKLGLAATTNPGGVKKWRASFAQHFVGKQVVILPDNDAAGQEHAKLVAKNLAKTAASVRIVTLPGLPPKGDISDWLEGRSKDDLLALVEASSASQPKLRPSTGEADYILDAKTGAVRDLVANAVMFLECQEELQDRFRFNIFSSLIEVRDLPWGQCDWRPLEDHDHLCLANYAQRAEVTVRQTNCFDAMRVVAVRNQHHPVTAYLDNLDWDGTHASMTGCSPTWGSPTANRKTTARTPLATATFAPSAQNA